MNYNFSKKILTLYGIGFINFFPGTLASFFTCAIFYLFWLFIGLKDYQLLIYIFLISIFFYSIIFINKIYKNEDSKEIVIDEFVGQSIPIMSFYYLYNSEDFNFFSDLVGNNRFESWIILSFFLFRFFDILKPFPINLIDNKIKNGFGVMFDDVLAGIYSAISLYIIFIWI